MNQDELTKLIAEMRDDGPTTLDLSGKGLKYLSPGIGDLAGLTRLNLRANQLTELPPEIGNLTSLKELNLTDNQLRSLPPPPRDRNLTSLASLSLGHDQVAEVLTGTSDLGSLSTQPKLGNPLTKLPPEIGNLAALEELDLVSNQLTGSEWQPVDDPAYRHRSLG